MSATRTLHLGAEIASLVRTRINAKAIHSDVQREFRFLLCGDPALVLQLRSALMEPYVGVAPQPESALFIETLAPSAGVQTVMGSDIRCIIQVGYPSDPAPSVELLGGFKVPIIALVVDESVTQTVAPSPPERSKVETIRVPSLASDDLRPRFFPFLIDCCKGVEVAVGRRLPILREQACIALTRDAARNALKIAAASAVMEQVPLLGFVVGAVAAAGDTVAISVVQLNLVLRIGAVFERDPQIGAAWELVPIIGGGLGWRALSRELTGFIPVAGVAIKGAIAYAGTVVVGEGAAFYYRTGRHMSAQDARKIYMDTRRAAIELARDLVGRLRGRG